MNFLGAITGGLAGNNLLQNISHVANQALDDVFDQIKEKHGIEKNDFFQVKDEVALASAFKNVQVFLTEKRGQLNVWKDTKLIGSLYPI